jgi:hypothetical protein
MLLSALYIALVFLRRYKKLSCLVAIGTLVIFAAIRGEKVDRDYLTYFYLWYINIQDFSYYYFEPFSKIILTISKEYEVPFFIAIGFFAFISLSLKLFCVAKLRGDIAAFCALYIGYFYWQHDMTQIRVAAALGFIYLSFYFWCKQEKAHSFLFFIMGCLFHTSVVNLVIMYFLDTKKKTLLVYLIIMILCYGFYFLGFDLVIVISNLVSLLPFLGKYQFYFSGDWAFQQINVLSFTNISLILIAIISVFYILRKDESFDSSVVISAKIFIIGLSCIPAFASLPVASFRISQILLVFMPLYLSLLITTLPFNIKAICLVFVLLYSLGLTYAVIDSANILEPYYTIM